MFESVINFIQDIYKTKDFISLHEPRFIGNEKKYINECIESTYVSSVGKFVNEFEEQITSYTGAKYAVATVNGTSALHISLLMAKVEKGNEVITQSLNFVAGCNAISYCGAQPVFIDVDKETMGLSPSSLKIFLENNTSIKNKQCINNKTGKIIKACMPMHTFGHPCRIVEIKEICDEYNIFLIEDAAESIGSRYEGLHTGTFGQVGVFSFNGNKVITAGGGGCIITNNKALAKLAKHLTTTAKVNHKWDFFHDMIGYNYRMPNLNAALLVAQLENLEFFLNSKRNLALSYNNFFSDKAWKFFNEPNKCKSNYWLNSIIFENKLYRDKFLDETNACGIMTRPIWILMNKLPMYSGVETDKLVNSNWLEERVVNIPSSSTL